MAEIKITQADLTAAEEFLVEYLTEKVPEASFEKGSAMRDLVVNAFTYIFAYLKYEVDFSRIRQSLVRLNELTDAEDISQAADEILSNWFLSRKGGQLARLTARLHFLQRRTYSIPIASKFWRTPTLAFYLDTTSDPYTIPDTALYPVYSTSGDLVDYVADVPLRAGRLGEGYNIEPGTFIRADFPGGVPFFTYAENLSAASGGKGVESTSELITRAQTAITVRNLVNNRSCDTVLQQEFPELLDTLTIGMGEPEMVRDRRTEIASHIRLHTGGCYDTYLGLRLQTVEDTGVVGGYFPRADEVACVFRDPLLTYGTPVPGSGVPFTDPTIDLKVGDVIYILSGIPGAPRGFQLVSVSDHELEVSTAIPFTEATDESGSTLVYSAGAVGPTFADKIAARTAALSTNINWDDVPAGTSRHIKSEGKILLTGRPVQDIEMVEVVDPTGAMSALVDSTTGTITFPVRVNTQPTGPATDPAYNQYQLNVRNPAVSQSAKMVTEINVGFATDPDYFDGLNLRVRYQTLYGFDNIHTYTRNREYRVAAASHLVRAKHPVWISAEIPYKMKATMADALLDETAMAQLLSDYINAFDTKDNLDMSDLSVQMRNADENVGVVYPFTIRYTLHSPDGQLVEFGTTDVVSIFMDDDSGVYVENSADIVVPQALLDQGITVINSKSSLDAWYDLYGISDRTIQYRSAPSYITFTRQG